MGIDPAEGAPQGRSYWGRVPNGDPMGGSGKQAVALAGSGRTRPFAIATVAPPLSV